MRVGRPNAISALSLGGLFGLWWLLADVLGSWKLPHPLQVFGSFHAMGGAVLLDIAFSLFHLAMGVIASVLAGVFVGAAMGWSRPAEQILGPVVELLRPIPPLAWVPFAIVWLQLTHWAAAFIIFIGSVFPILISTYAGVKDTPKLLVEAARMLGCTHGRDLMVRIALPWALPSILSGIRVGIGIGWMCLIASEIFGQAQGIGFRLWYFYQLHQMDRVAAYMVLLGVLGLSLDYGFRALIESRLLRWQTGLVK